MVSDARAGPPHLTAPIGSVVQQLAVHTVGAAYYCQPVGDDRFQQQIERCYGIKPGRLERGVHARRRCVD